MSFAEWQHCQLDVTSDGHVSKNVCNVFGLCRAEEKVHFALQWCAGLYRSEEYIWIMKKQ